MHNITNATMLRLRFVLCTKEVAYTIAACTLPSNEGVIPMSKQTDTTRLHRSLHFSCLNGLESFPGTFFTSFAKQERYSN